eukprot:GDKI01013843.1.p3 GENE.GDKI01013843.1~~GDKI01013843.1.p3  ORF type:complete len:103 (-),score=32.54 GDKI01013843.1:16-324(-)
MMAAQTRRVPVRMFFEELEDMLLAAGALHVHAHIQTKKQFCLQGGVFGVQQKQEVKQLVGVQMYNQAAYRASHRHVNPPQAGGVVRTHTHLREGWENVPCVD